MLQATAQNVCHTQEPLHMHSHELGKAMPTSKRHETMRPLGHPLSLAGHTATTHRARRQVHRQSSTPGPLAEVCGTRHRHQPGQHYKSSGANGIHHFIQMHVSPKPVGIPSGTTWPWRKASGEERAAVPADGGAPHAARQGWL